MHSPALPLAGTCGIGDADDLARSRDRPFKADAEGDSVRLKP
jgi:hypothetical protein